MLAPQGVVQAAAQRGPGNEPRYRKVGYLMLGLLTTATEQLGKMKSLDPIAKQVSSWVSKATSPAAVKNALSGTWLGHPLHPMATDVPIGAWTMATALDVCGGESTQTAAQHLVGIGVLTSLPAAASGASDWSDTIGKDRRIGLVHAVGNSVGTTMQVASWCARRSGRHRLGVGLSFLGLGATMGAAYLGGHLSFARGVNVNHTAFETPVRKWTDVAAADDVTEGQLVRVNANKTPVMLTRHKGQLRALSATCVHAGGALDEGHIDKDCVVCPLHQSTFRLSDGKPVRGPAAMEQPTWDVQTMDGRIQVKIAA